MSALSGVSTARPLGTEELDPTRRPLSLLGLPGELRNQIYSYIFNSAALQISARENDGACTNQPGFVFTQYAPHTFQSRRRKSPLGDYENYLPKVLTMTPWYGLIASCRTLHSEAYPLVFSSGTAIFSNLWVLEKFCACIPETYRAMLTSVHTYLSFHFPGDVDDVAWIREVGLKFEDMFPAVNHVRIDEDENGSEKEDSKFFRRWVSGSEDNGVELEWHSWSILWNRGLFGRESVIVLH